MERGLELYEEPYDPRYPVVCFDERPCQLLAHAQAPQPAQPGRVQHEDYESVRHGRCSVLLAFEPLGWRYAEVRPHRRQVDVGQVLHTVLEHDNQAARVRLLCANLHTHSGAAFYEDLLPAQARRATQRIEFGYTPVHGRWLNRVEIELAALVKQCLDRRLPSLQVVQQEVAAWVHERNRCATTLKWQFTTADARIKLKRLYPSILP